MANAGRRVRGYRVAGHGPAATGAAPSGGAAVAVEQAATAVGGKAAVDGSGARLAWVGPTASMIAALVAVGGLFYTGRSLAQSSADVAAQNKITEAGQITDRFNAAVTNLGSNEETIRIGGVYALQRVMFDSRVDQPAVIQVLTAFIRENAPLSAKSAAPPKIDVQAALGVLATRDPDHDYGTIINLAETDLNSADLTGAQLAGADLNGAQLNGAVLIGANLTGAHLDGANLAGAFLSGQPWCDASGNPNPNELGGYICVKG